MEHLTSCLNEEEVVQRKHEEAIVEYSSTFMANPRSHWLTTLKLGMSICELHASVQHHAILTI
jgi:hypothetical protein